MSSIPTVDHALEEVHDLELASDEAGNDADTCACLRVLDLLLEKRLRLPQQRPAPHQTGARP